jgi:hypothetical protein
MKASVEKWQSKERPLMVGEMPTINLWKVSTDKRRKIVHTFLSLIPLHFLFGRFPISLSLAL